MFEAPELLNPFPGLRPFETEENNLFFGRDGQSDELLTFLRRRPFLAVVGTSGSGKSSLIRAGLLPALYGGLMGKAGSNWRIAIFRPGHDPIGNLARALGEQGGFGGVENSELQNTLIETTLRRSSIGLVDAAEQARMSPHENLLIVVDQFEELFRFKEARKETTAENDAAAFVKLLIEAGTQTNLPIYVVLTMRSDFLGDCSQFAGLPEAINQGQYLIPRMSRDERRAAITGPVAVGGGEITLPLVNRLLNDVGDNPDQLPILQHALMRTWDYCATHRRNGEPVGLEHYEAIGTMSEALSRHADEAFAELPDERSRNIAEKLFKRLTERGADNREIRRPTRLAEICTVVKASEDEVVAVIDVFRREGRSFLMPPAGVELNGETVIDISHESLIRNWKRLQVWVDEEAQSARTYRRLAEAATLHREGSEGLLQDPGLQIALDWRDKSKPNAPWAGRYQPEFDESIAYLEQSRAARDAAAADRERRRNAELERERREREQAQLYAAEQRRAAQRLRRYILALVVISLIALTGAGAAVFAFARARSSESRAQDLASTLKDRIKTVEKLTLDLQSALKVANDAKDDAAHQRDVAMTAQGKAEDQRKRAESEATRANKQTRIADQNLVNAKLARDEAVANSAQFKAAVERNGIIRDGLEAFRRKEYEVALHQFEELRKRLEPLQRGAPQIGGQKRPPDESRQFVIDLGWTNSNIGTTQWLMSDNEQAVTAFEKALATLKVLTDKADPINKDLLMYETYSGLGYAYHQVALIDALKSGQGVDPKPAFAKSEAFFQKALEFQQNRAIEKRNEIKARLSTTGETYDAPLQSEVIKIEEEVATGFGNLARLYHDARRLPEAEQNFIKAVDHLQKSYGDRNRIIAALRELGQFYREQSRLEEAARAYNQLIDIQDKEASFEESRNLADSYLDLGQVYSDQNNDEKANKTYKVANLLQQVGLKYRKEEEALNSEEALNGDSKAVMTLDDDLDALGDAYVELGRYDQAEETYKSALDVRLKFKANDRKREKSYQKLGDMFYNRIKNLDYAKHHTEKDYSEAYTKAIDYYDMLVGFYEPSPPAALKLKYNYALLRLGSIYAKDPSTYSAAEEKLKRALAVLDETPSTPARYETLSALAILYKNQERTAELEAVLVDRVKLLEGLVIGNFAVGTDISKNLPAAADYPEALRDLIQFYLKQNRTAEAEAAYSNLLRVDMGLLDKVGDLVAIVTYRQLFDEYAKLLIGPKYENDRIELAARNKRMGDRAKTFEYFRNLFSDKTRKVNFSNRG